MTENSSPMVYYKRVKEKLDEVSPSMCLAKWQQVTLHLATGHTHSCHHPNTHKIPVSEIEIDPSALHNTSFKKQQRKLMIEGVRPAECEYCWNVEDNVKEPDIYSDRVYKSGQSWARDYANDVLDASYTKNIDPTYLEVSFSNVCNFKCSYCSPEVSSKWMEEIKEYGAYPTSGKFNNIEWLARINKMPIPEREDNPYIEAFWKWWPSLYPKLHTFRITGGEPLLTKNTFKVLDHVIENPNTNLELIINSNLCVPEELFNKFIEKVKIIQDRKLVKSFKLFTSCEAHGARAEYIRYGLNYDQWLNNCDRFLREIPTAELGLMSTYNILSVTSYIDFMKDILKLNNEHSNSDRPHPVVFDIPYLRYPDHQNIIILSRDYLKLIEDQVTFMYRNKEFQDWAPLANRGFFDFEINKLKTVYHLLWSTFKVNEDLAESTKVKRKDFVKFIDEHDRRRGTNFLKTFPEMAEFYHMCKSL
jgi:organic radical activating enzyme